MILQPEITLEMLFGIASELAKDQFDGHLTIMRFTTNWRVGYGTPTDDGHTRDFIGCLTEGETLYDALLGFIIGELCRRAGIVTVPGLHKIIRIRMY